MSKTPRTDQIEKLVYWIQDDMTPVCESGFVRQLERELNEANDRIKRLEEAGNMLEHNNGAMAQQAWRKAKEDKP